MPRRPSFLTLFFTGLTILFSLTVLHRLRQPESGSRLDSEPVRPPVVGHPALPAAVDRRPTTTSDGGPVEAVEKQRAAQYRELLREAPPAAASKPSAAQANRGTPSLISRVVAPIVSAFSGSGDLRPPGPPSGSIEREAGATQRLAAPSRSDTTSDRPAAGTSDDPDSDTTAPRLLGVEFKPAAVQDGEGTLLIVTASDDLSGIRTIAGNLASPSGALQGFSVEKEGENRFVARVAIPKNAAEGLWYVNFLSLTDEASNTAILSWRQNTIPKTASFLVSSSKPDTTAPVVRSIWLERPAVHGGERVAMFVETEEDQAGVHLVTGVFISPSKFARIPVGCRQQSPQSAVWQCDVAPPARSDCGDWQLEQLQVQDKANNQAVLRSDNALVGRVRLNVTSDNCDSTPPAVQTVAVEVSAVAAPGVVRIIVTASDDSSGISTINGHFAFAGAVSGSQPPRLYFSCRAAASGQTWTGAITVHEKAARGLWKLGSLQLADAAGNLKIYVDPDPLLSGVTFRVE